MSPSIGMVFVPTQPPQRMRAAVLAAERYGVDELWVWEDCFRQSGIATAAAALAWTERLRVGIGLMPAPLRNAALLAMEVATLEGMFPGRLRPAVGHGVQDWMGQVGVRADSPLTLLREVTTALRALLAGVEVTTEGRYVRLDRVALDWPPAQPVPVLAGGFGPRSLRLAGESADGVVVAGGIPLDGVREAVAHAVEGRAAAGREGRPHVVAYLVAATGPDAAARLAADHRHWGLDPDRAGGVAGDADAVADAVRRWAGAGVDTVVLQPPFDETDLEGYARFVGEEVTPRLRA